MEKVCILYLIDIVVSWVDCCKIEKIEKGRLLANDLSWFIGKQEGVSVQKETGRGWKKKRGKRGTFYFIYLWFNGLFCLFFFVGGLSKSTIKE